MKEAEIVEKKKNMTTSNFYQYLPLTDSVVSFGLTVHIPPAPSVLPSHVNTPQRPQVPVQVARLRLVERLYYDADENSMPVRIKRKRKSK